MSYTFEAPCDGSGTFGYRLDIGDYATTFQVLGESFSSNANLTPRQIAILAGHFLMAATVMGVKVPGFEMAPATVTHSGGA